MQQFISPGAWLCDITRERYEVKEKKTIKKVVIMCYVCARLIFEYSVLHYVGLVLIMFSVIIDANDPSCYDAETKGS